MTVDAKPFLKNNTHLARIEKIIGGNEVDIKFYPYQVSISIDGARICGGSIISPNLILTASLCVHDRFNGFDGYNKAYDPEKFKVRSGSSYKSKAGALSTVSQVIPHEEFFHNLRHEDDPWADSLGLLNLAHDIAILALSKPLIYDNNTREISLLARPLEEYNVDAYISGWGVYQKWPDKETETLRAYKIRAHGEQYCPYRTVTERTICADTGTHVGTCYGDTGGPLTVEEHLAGIVSNIPDNCGNRYGRMYFTSIWQHKDWIEKKIAQYSK